MSLNLSHGKNYDVQGYGLTREDLSPIGESREDTQFDIATLFDEDRRLFPLEFEIGSGKGTFLVQQATQMPEVNFLGVEYARAFWEYAADRVRRHGLNGVRMLHYDATVFVKWYVPDETFRQVHIYFPDPWPKARHHKRRTVREDVLRELCRVLEPNGCVRIVTDHEDYYQWMLEHVARVTDVFEKIPFERPISAGDGEVVGTNFERKYRREGRPFNAMILEKK